MWVRSSLLVKRCRGVGFRKTRKASTCTLYPMPREPQTLQLDSHGVSWNFFFYQVSLLVKGHWKHTQSQWGLKRFLVFRSGHRRAMGVWLVPCLPFQRLRESFSVSGPNRKVKQKLRAPLEPHSAGSPRNKRLFLPPVRLGWLLAVSYFYPPFWALISIYRKYSRTVVLFSSGWQNRSP